MKTIRAAAILVLAALVFAAADRSGFAQATGKLVAVLELNNKAGLTDDEADFLTNNVRNVASQVLPRDRFVIMTRENIEMLLPPGMDLKKCTESKCEIEVGRKLGAEYIVTGEILKIFGNPRIQLSVHHVPSGNFLGSRNTGAAPLSKQEPQLLKAADEVMRLILAHAGVAPAMPEGGSTAAPSAQTAASGSPAGATAAADPEFEKLVRAEQARIEAQKRADAENKAKLDADYAAVKAIHDNTSYSAEAKKAAYQRFVEKWSADATRRPEVQQWLQAGEVPAGMVRIPGGTFTMGCSPGDAECNPDEIPAHQVTVNGFSMDATPVTQAQYQSVIGSNPSHFSGCADCPVETVSWNDAQAYCAKAGKRLPTEAEWEFAARGGTTGSRYGDIDAVAWYGKNSGSKTHPVGRKQANAYGLYDMLGNVWEWCADWYDDKYYSSSTADNPKGPSSGTARVLRGGSWDRAPGGVRASARAGGGPGGRLDYFGFRCARD